MAVHLHGHCFDRRNNTKVWRLAAEWILLEAQCESPPSRCNPKKNIWKTSLCIRSFTKLRCLLQGWDPPEAASFPELHVLYSVCGVFSFPCGVLKLKALPFKWGLWGLLHTVRFSAIAKDFMWHCLSSREVAHYTDQDLSESKCTTSRSGRTRWHMSLKSQQIPKMQAVKSHMQKNPAHGPVVKVLVWLACSWLFDRHANCTFQVRCSIDSVTVYVLCNQIYPNRQICLLVGKEKVC